MKILIVDDDTLVTLSLKTIVESSNDITVCAVGNSGEEAVELFREHRPDVLLMDIRMGGITGIEAASQIMREFPDGKILFLTTFSDDEYITRALEIGAGGYILKQNFESIVPSLRAVYLGQSVFGKEIVGKIPSIISKAEKFDPKEYGLLEKEGEIIKLVAEGLSNKEISEKIYLSEGTVRNYISSILEKLQLRDRTQLAIFYLERK